MVTNAVMESLENRLIKVGGAEVIVRQRTKDKFFALRDVERVINVHRWNVMGLGSPVHLSAYFALDSTKAFIKALQEKKQCEPHIRARGKSEGWIHPHLFLDILLWANPEFKIEVYDWLFDYLIESRINSADSYRLMCGVLYEFSSRKDLFKKELIKIANDIKDLLCVSEWNKASELQLKRRDELQNMIADLTATLQNPQEAVRIAFVNYRRKYLGENPQILLESEVIN